MVSSCPQEIALHSEAELNMKAHHLKQHGTKTHTLLIAVERLDVDDVVDTVVGVWYDSFAREYDC